MALVGHHSSRWAPASLGCFTARILRAAIFKSLRRARLGHAAADYSYEVITLDAALSLFLCDAQSRHIFIMLSLNLK